MSRHRRTLALSVAIALGASCLTAAFSAPAAQAEERLPATEFRVCSVPSQFFCIESVTFEMDGLPPVNGVWVPSGQASAPTDDTSVVPSTPGQSPTSSKLTYPGRWSFPGFPSSTVGYDGVYVQVGPASTASDFAWVRMQPAAARADLSIGQAVVAEGSYTPRDLDPGMKTTVVMRFGPLEPTANVMVADGMVTTTSVNGANNVSFSGYPVKVARQASSSDCTGESGKAMDVVSQQYAFIVFGNTRQSFGYDGMSGNLSVSTNGTCSMSTPSYDAASGGFTFTAAAPHFAPDGTTVNRGFYIASIPMQDAALLFGITNPKDVKAVLELSMENDQGVDVPVQYSVAARKGVISIAVMNFAFSKPTITVKVKTALWKKKYKKAAEKARRAAGN